MLQQPRQLAEALLFLDDKKINTYFEIGTFNGVATCLISAFLIRNNPEFRGTTIDNLRVIDGDLYHFLTDSCDVAVANGISDNYKQSVHDLVFIDGDHTYEWISRDYENVGKYAKYCMFHDINDEWVPSTAGDDGVMRFWRELEGDKCEFCQHPENKRYFGIGILCASQNENQ
jgi:hypothetical protein